uniref:Uncharacterized protein n=1 Tax=Arundo donax TaxID=35708 RepID=A0A0A8Z5K7_ARUDO
MNYSRQGHY